MNNQDQDIIIYQEASNNASLQPYEQGEYKSSRGATVEQIIGLWLDSVKLKRSRSEKTQRDYAATIYSFRAFLQNIGIDLLCNNRSNFTQEIADAAGVWSNKRVPGSHHAGMVSSATIGARLSILSSFYIYVVKRGHVVQSVGNPISLVDRPSVKRYRNAHAISREVLDTALSSIDQNTLTGARNLTLLTILLVTGMRVNEVCSMTKKSLLKSGTQIIIEVDTKGGKVRRDQLDAEVSNLLLAWLQTYYAGIFWKLPDDTPIWPSLAGKKSSQSLRYQGVRDICIKYLGTSKVHTTRHSFVALMLEASAKLNEIQHALGHSSANTTAEYVESLEGSYNPYSATIASAIGVARRSATKRTSK